jgi:hypothetical protein
MSKNSIIVLKLHFYDFVNNGFLMSKYYFLFLVKYSSNRKKYDTFTIPFILYGEVTTLWQELILI